MSRRTRKAEDEDRSPRSAGDKTPHAGAAPQGFARGKDLQDTQSQAKAPTDGGKAFDRTGEKEYEEGLEEFEDAEASGEDFAIDADVDDDEDEIDTEADDRAPARRGR
jgi:hypothetical protein